MARTVSIVIPCYNEAATIEELLRRVERADFGAWTKEIIVVDDGSKDSTRTILEKYHSKPGYQIIFQQKNGGKGVAEKAGIAAAKGDYIALQDADLEYDPQEIKKMIEVVEKTGAPIVFGSRNMESPWKRARNFFTISVGVWASTKWVNLLYGTRLTDAWTCYKLFSREVAQKAKFIGNGFEADYLFIGDASVKGFPIVEVAITHKPRTVEEGKKIRYMDGIRSMTLLLMHRLANLRKLQNVTPDAHRRARIEPHFACPLCRSPLSGEGKNFRCTNNHEFKSLPSGIPILADMVSFENDEDEHLSGVNWLKSFFKQFPAVYYFIWHLFCPVLMIQNRPTRIFEYTGADALIADIGSGPDRLSEKFINLDLFPFPGVDVVGSADRLPFKDATFDGLTSESLLEHVADPKGVAAEMIRVVKPGGYIYASAPFIHPFHASPDDFNRFTKSGLKELFPGFEVKEVGVRSGPWSAFLIFLAYWLGVVFSFGSRKVSPFLAHIFMLILGPLKFFDILFSKLPDAEAVSAHLYIIVRKPKA